MSSSVNMTYASAYEVAASLLYQNHLLQYDPVWVRDNLSSTKGMKEFSVELFKRVDACRQFLSSGVPFEEVDIDDEYPALTSIAEQISLLDEKLQSNLMTCRYYKIFKEELLDKFEVLSFVSPAQFPIQPLLSRHLKKIERILSEGDWISRNLDTAEKVNLFVSSFFQLLDINAVYLVSTFVREEAPQDILPRISRMLEGHGLVDIFDTSVISNLPELIEKGKSQYVSRLSSELSQRNIELSQHRTELANLKALKEQSVIDDREFTQRMKALVKAIALREVGCECLFEDLQYFLFDQYIEMVLTKMEKKG